MLLYSLKPVAVSHLLCSLLYFSATSIFIRISVRNSTRYAVRS